MILKGLGRFHDVGLLIIRVGLGLAMMKHGWPKIMGGSDMWTGLGQGLGLPMPVVFGFLAALSEFGGGLLLAIGFLHRIAAIMLAATMAGALMFHLKQNDGFDKYSHALELLIVFVGLIFIGPGKYSIDRK